MVSKAPQNYFFCLKRQVRAAWTQPTSCHGFADFLLKFVTETVLTLRVPG